MKIFIELPTWLGDAVMATPAVENLLNNIFVSEIVIIGSRVSIEVFKYHPKVKKIIVLDRNYFKLFNKIKSFDKFDFFVSFRSSLRSSFLMHFIKASNKYKFDKKKFTSGHQVEKYNNFINTSLGIKSVPKNLKIHFKKNENDLSEMIAGINPGASYGQAKRWYPERFGDVALELSKRYKIVIFGGPNEVKIARDIEKYLVNNGVKNYKNLANKTSVHELINRIANLDLFVTGDSGPMHIAAAFKIPTVSIFGPTNDFETSQWRNENGSIVKKNLDCQPCMKRKCPLSHHNCMKKISASKVLEALEAII